jgi:glycosyltransferase involved in cell wall biosynthesis
VRYDAISYSVRLKLDFLRSLKRRNPKVEVNVFVQGTDIDDPDIHVRSLRDIVLDERFTRSNLFIYELGIDYDLFDSLFMLAHDQRSLGIYHNLTPPELVEAQSTRRAVERGLLMRQNLALLDHVACDSDFNRRDLIDCGLQEDRLSVLPLPPRTSAKGHEAREWTSNPVDVLFVGRFVRAKGLYDLLDAAGRLERKEARDFRITLAGSPQFSEPDVMRAIHSAASAKSYLRVVLDPDDDALDRLYRGSSVLVMPSYHEGYCLPVLEALSAGCQVVAYDAGNLPAITGGLGQIVGTGDVAGLAGALRKAMDATRSVRERGSARVPTVKGYLEQSRWSEAVLDHLKLHSRERYERLLLDIFDGMGIHFGPDTLRERG